MESQPRQDGDIGEWVSLQEAAQRLGVSIDTVRRRAKAKELPSRQTPMPQGFRWEVFLAGTYADAGSENGEHRSHVGERPTRSLEAALALIDKLTQQNVQLAGQVGFLQGKLEDAQARLLLLEAPKIEPGNGTAGETAKRPWWKFWERGEPLLKL